MSAALHDALPSLPSGGPAPAAPARPLGILSLSCVFPGPGRAGFGSFVRFRLEALARHAMMVARP